MVTRLKQVVFSILIWLCALSLTTTQAQEFLACSSKTSPSQLSEWNNLVREVAHTVAGDDLKAFLGVNPKFLIAHSTIPTAYVLGSRKVVLTTALLERLPTPKDLAIVVAHEMGHIALGHAGTRGLADPHLLGLEAEIEADRFAVRLVGELGIEPERVAELLTLLSTSGNASPFNKNAMTYSMLKRIEAIRSAAPSARP